MIDATKQCCRCQEVKPVADFGRWQRAKDGRRAACRACMRARYQGEPIPYDRLPARLRDPWSDDDLAKLKQLWSVRPYLSVAAIAEQVGRSRNAVVGKADRLNLPKRDGTQRERVRPDPVRHDPVPRTPHPLEAVGARQCCFPIGDPRKPGFHYCGADTERPGLDYCAVHQVKVYRPAPKPVEEARA